MDAFSCLWPGALIAEPQSTGTVVESKQEVVLREGASITELVAEAARAGHLKVVIPPEVAAIQSRVERRYSFDASTNWPCWLEDRRASEFRAQRCGRTLRRVVRRSPRHASECAGRRATRGVDRTGRDDRDGGRATREARFARCALSTRSRLRTRRSPEDSRVSVAAHARAAISCRSRGRCSRRIHRALRHRR